jgi:hypothetical protein
MNARVRGLSPKAVCDKKEEEDLFQCGSFDCDCLSEELGEKRGKRRSDEQKFKIYVSVAKLRSGKSKCRAVGAAA